MGNGFYYFKGIYKEIDDIEVYQGFKLTPLLNANKVFIKIDPTFRVVRYEDFLITLKKNKFKFDCTGKSLTTNYGNRKNYTIEKIDPEKTPRTYRLDV